MSEKPVFITNVNLTYYGTLTKGCKFLLDVLKISYEYGAQIEQPDTGSIIYTLDKTDPKPPIAERKKQDE